MLRGLHGFFCFFLGPSAASILFVEVLLDLSNLNQDWVFLIQSWGVEWRWERECMQPVKIEWVVMNALAKSRHSQPDWELVLRAGRLWVNDIVTRFGTCLWVSTDGQLGGVVRWTEQRSVFPAYSDRRKRMRSDYFAVTWRITRVRWPGFKSINAINGARTTTSQLQRKL